MLHLYSTATWPTGGSFKHMCTMYNGTWCHLPWAGKLHGQYQCSLKLMDHKDSLLAQSVLQLLHSMSHTVPACWDNQSQLYPTTKIWVVHDHVRYHTGRASSDDEPWSLVLKQRHKYLGQVNDLWHNIMQDHFATCNL